MSPKAPKSPSIFVLLAPGTEIVYDPDSGAIDSRVAADPAPIAAKTDGKARPPERRG
ncbi:MAG: hypothetical protein ACUVYA_07960 [Planctomycetota bacterium]